MVVPCRIEVDADKAAHIIAEQLGVNDHLGTGDDFGGTHFFDPDMDRGRADIESLGHFGIGSAGIIHQGVEDFPVEIINSNLAGHGRSNPWFIRACSYLILSPRYVAKLYSKNTCWLANAPNLTDRTPDLYALDCSFVSFQLATAQGIGL
ncbi:hypothetical protein H744_2c0238 [Photobacterium gaetbulicola Gung47]|uniref:Uncharacterized protein n=1 Tax=Photobacterium gaetbulicola Gung47 TaxID=658445 RepID=A0A0C5W655_9GAMM|nr:hypothetical protein H744_2c0238 [Photobacterium gaetbulicola Gung47]